MVDVEHFADLPDVMTIAETANLLRLSRNGTYELARTGQIPTLRLGRRLVVPKEALRRLLEMPPQASDPRGDR